MLTHREHFLNPKKYPSLVAQTQLSCGFRASPKVMLTHREHFPIVSDPPKNRLCRDPGRVIFWLDRELWQLKSFLLAPMFTCELYSREISPQLKVQPPDGVPGVFARTSQYC
jgi:hypothetical protein